MKKKILSLVLALTLCIGLAIPAMAASDEAVAAANKLNELGLFNGVGDNADGTPNYDLDRAPTRMEAVTLLVRLLGKEIEARAGSWTIPFTDVADWAKPYVGYAYANGLTSGTSASTFSGNDIVSATQYLTFVLRALGYSSDSDFAWNAAWELTDKLGVTSGEYGATSAFTRGDAVIVSAAALDKELKDGSKTLLEAIEEALANAPEGPSVTGGNAGKTFTCTGNAEVFAFSTLYENFDGTDKAKATVEVISASEAVFTLEFPFSVSEANDYIIGFRSTSGEYRDLWFKCFTTSSSGVDEFYADGTFSPYNDRLEVTFSNQSVEDNKITWRAKLPVDSFFNFDMIGDYEMLCEITCLYGG